MILATTLAWALSLVALITALTFFKKCIVENYYLRKLPGPPTKNYLLGNTAPLLTSPAEIFRILRRWGLEFYPIYNLCVGHLPAINIINPDDFELILSSVKHIKKSMVYTIFDEWLHSGLLTSNGEKWHQRRKILTPTFHFSILQQFLTIFNEETTTLVENLKEECKKENVIAIDDHITRFTLKTIGETAMGTKFDFEKSETHEEYQQSIKEMGLIYVHRIVRPWLAYKFTYIFTPTYYKEHKLVKKLQKFTKDVIAKRQQDFKGIKLTQAPNGETYSTRKRLAMLDLLLSIKTDEGLIDDEGIREEVDTFMFEGHDTTSAAICFALMEIASHESIQDKIVAEMRDVLGDIKKKPTFSDLAELKYLDMCVKEVLRLYPSVHYISRELGEDVVTKDGYFVPKNSIVNLHIYDLHHSPHVYPDPENFDPDRFLPENTLNRHPFAYVPFSAGPRNCIGQKFAMIEMKAVICGILGNFKLEPIDTAQSIVLVADIVLKAKDSIKIKFIPRN